MSNIEVTRPAVYEPPGVLRRVFGPVVRNLVLALFAAITLYPLLLVVSTALKDPQDLLSSPFSLFSSFRWQNLQDAWTIGEFGTFFWNSVLVTAPTVLGVVALSTMAGYAFGRLSFPGRSLLFFTFLLGLMIPFTSVMIPLFYQLRDMGLLGTLSAVVLSGVGGVAGYGLPLGVFLMRAFFQDLPNDLAEAARVDGANEWQVFLRVMLPLSAPGIAVLAVLVFFQSWNQFLLPFLYLPGEENRVLASGLYFFATGRTQDFQLIASGSLIMVVPVLVIYMLFQRQFVKGVTAGALKG